MKRFLSAILAVFVLATCLSIPVFAADGETLLCPECGSTVTLKKHDYGFAGSVVYTCSNSACDYKRQVHTVVGWDFYEKGSASDPIYSDGNTSMQIQGGEATPQYTTVPCDFIYEGKPAWYLTPSQPTMNTSIFSVSGYTAYVNANEANCPGVTAKNTYFMVFGRDYWNYNTLSGINWSREGLPAAYYSLFADFRNTGVPRIGVYGTNFNGGRALLNGQNTAGPIRQAAVLCNTGKVLYSYDSSDTLTYAYAYSSDYGVSAAFRAFVVMEKDANNLPLSFDVTNNNYINVIDKSITVNGNATIYNNAYYDNGVYYVYTDNGITTYYTDNSGQIIGDVTYDNSTKIYNITIYDKDLTTPDPTPSPTPDPDNPNPTPGPGVDPSPTPKPDKPSGGGGGNWLTDLLGDILGSIIDGLLSFVKLLLDVILKLIGKLFEWIFKFTLYVSSFLGGVLPAYVLAPLILAVPIVFILGIVKFIKG